MKLLLYLIVIVGLLNIGVRVNNFRRKRKLQRAGIYPMEESMVTGELVQRLVDIGEFSLAVAVYRRLNGGSLMNAQIEVKKLQKHCKR